MFAENPVTSVARALFTRIGVDGWAGMPLDAQCALPLKYRRVVGWLIVTGSGPPRITWWPAGPTLARSPRTFSRASRPIPMRAQRRGQRVHLGRGSGSAATCAPGVPAAHPGEAAAVSDASATHAEFS
jgi:hypothetical protein